MSKIKFISFLILCAGLISCRKKELPKPSTPPIDTSVVTKGRIRIQLRNVVGDVPLILNNSLPYLSPNGEEFTVSIYNYYISNIVFIDENGNRFVEPDSYHLAMADNSESLNIEVKNVSFGNYTSVEFLIGVDSLHNVSGAQGGYLNPSYGMFWTWSTGYIMAKVEGSSNGKPFAYHIAGFKGIESVLQKINLTFPNKASVTKEIIPEIFLQSDLNTWFAQPAFQGFSVNPVIVKEGTAAFNISINYRKMFSINSVKN